MNLSEQQATAHLQSANTILRLVEQAQAKLERLNSQKLHQGKRRAEEQAAEGQRREAEVSYKCFHRGIYTIGGSGCCKDNTES